MKSFLVQLTSIADVKTFVTAASTQACDIDVVSGRYIIDAKSIMGLFSLDLLKPIRVEVQGSDAEADAFRAEIAALVVEEPEA
jgi:phosphotransferase system HPr-like phosphotransfer protein